MKSLHVRKNSHFFLKALVLQFQIEVALAEYAFHCQSFFFGTLVIAVKQMTLNLACQTRRKCNDTLAVLTEHFPVNSRLIVESVSVPLGHDFHQISVAFIVSGKQNQMTHPLVLVHILVKPGACRSIHLTTYYRLDSLLQTFSVKIDYTEHHPVIGNCQRIHSKLLST